MIEQSGIAVVGLYTPPVAGDRAIRAVIIGFDERAGCRVDDVAGAAELVGHVNELLPASNIELAFGVVAAGRHIGAGASLAHCRTAPERAGGRCRSRYRLCRQDALAEGVVGEHGLVGAADIVDLDESVLGVVFIGLEAVATEGVAIAIVGVGVAAARRELVVDIIGRAEAAGAVAPAGGVVQRVIGEGTIARRCCSRC